jgi:hypothetical protein
VAECRVDLAMDRQGDDSAIFDVELTLARLTPEDWHERVD